MTLIFTAQLASIFRTQGYDRVHNIAELEVTYLWCEVLKVEIDKAEHFVNNVSLKDSEFTKEDVLRLLGDFLIVNKLEYNEVIESLNLRLEELKITHRNIKSS